MLSDNLELSLRRSLIIANKYSHEYATLEHLLLSFLEDSEILTMMKFYKIKISALKRELINFVSEELIGLVADNKEDVSPTAAFQRLINRSTIRCNMVDAGSISSLDVLSEMFGERDSHAVFFMRQHGLSYLDIMNYVSPIENKKDDTENDFKGTSKISFESIPVSKSDLSKKNEKSEQIPSMLLSSKNKSKEVSSMLESYCINFNEQAKRGEIDVLVGREKEMEKMMEVLCLREKSNPLLVGEPGVGKSALVKGLANKIVNNAVPKPLKDAVIYSLDMGALLAGTKYRGDFEQRLKELIYEVEKHPFIILLIDDIHTVIGAGSTSGGSLDAGNLLKPALARGDFKCIGSIIYSDYNTTFVKEKALLRCFRRIDVEEVDMEECKKILYNLKPYYESYHNVVYSNEVIDATVSLSGRYITNHYFPDKAIDIIDEAGSYHKVHKASKSKDNNISVEDIERIVSDVARVPVKMLKENEISRIKNLKSSLQKVIYGQDQAIEKLVMAVKLSSAGLRNTTKPIGCYFFSGPTGVGKTELSIQLSVNMNMNFIRIDMSEYSEKHSISRLIGAPPGYVGFDQVGILTEIINKNPYVVILFDEIEKAGPEIYNLLLQIMDYGKITDNNGRELNFRNTIIILTSNAGASEQSKPALGFGRAERTGEDKKEIERLFSPEFRNRLDAIIPFNSLSKPIMRKVVNKFINILKSQLADKKIGIKLDASVKEYLLSRSFDLQKGARPLERIINEEIKNPLADEILFGSLSDGGKVELSYIEKEDRINFDFDAVKAEQKKTI